MQFQLILSSLLAAIWLGGVAQAIPIVKSPGPCPDRKVDAILNGKLAPEECCSYGVCLGDVVISMV